MVKGLLLFHSQAILEVLGLGLRSLNARISFSDVYALRQHLYFLCKDINFSWLI